MLKNVTSRFARESRNTLPVLVPQPRVRQPLSSEIVCGPSAVELPPPPTRMLMLTRRVSHLTHNLSVFYNTNERLQSDKATFEHFSNSGDPNDPERNHLLEEMRRHTDKLAKQRAHEDPRLSFSTPEYKEAQRRFTEVYKRRRKLDRRPQLEKIPGRFSKIDSEKDNSACAFNLNPCLFELAPLHRGFQAKLRPAHHLRLRQALSGTKRCAPVAPRVRSECTRRGVLERKRHPREPAIPSFLGGVGWRFYGSRLRPSTYQPSAHACVRRHSGASLP